MPMWNVCAQRLTAPIPAMAARHIGLNPGLVDEDQTAGIDASLVQFPPAAVASDVGSFLLAGEHGFFLRLMPSRRSDLHNVSQATMISRWRSSLSKACSCPPG